MASDRDLYASVTGTSGIISVNVDQDYSQPTANATIEATTTTLDLGDPVTIDIGYTDGHQQVFTGFLLEKSRTRSGAGLTWSLSCRDTLWRAMAMFIASDDPQTPLEYSNIASEDLIRAMLELSGITSYNLDSPGFTWAPEEPLEVQLTSAWDMISRVCHLIAWHCYDDNGTVRFLDRKPYPVGGDSSVHTFVTGNTGEITSVSPYAISSDKIRNRVVVYGDTGVYASASASSPFLPSGFYKTEVISAPDLIDTNGMAQDIANYNLDLLNRLEKSVTLEVIGVPSVGARDVVTVTETETGVSGDWFVYGCRHQFSVSYTQSLTLIQRQTS